MFTILLTIVGLIVLVVSCFTVGFKSGFKRLMTLAITGVILDALMAAIGLGALFILTH